MRYNVISAILFLFIVSLVACSNKQKKDPYKRSGTTDTAITKKIKIYSDKPENNYNKKLVVDTNGCEGFKKGRELIAILENKKCSIETTGVDLYLKTDKIKMWVCNMPKNIKTVGDTIIVSASIYNIFGDERTWGLPTILHTIRIKNH